MPTIELGPNDKYTHRLAELGRAGRSVRDVSVFWYEDLSQRATIIHAGEQAQHYWHSLPLESKIRLAAHAVGTASTDVEIVRLFSEYHQAMVADFDGHGGLPDAWGDPSHVAVVIEYD